MPPRDFCTTHRSPRPRRLFGGGRKRFSAGAGAAVRLAVFVPLAVLNLPTATLRATDSVTIEVFAGSQDRQNVPVALPLPETLKGQSRFALTRLGDGCPVPVQIEPSEPPRVVWMVDALGAGKTERYRLAPTSGPLPPDAVAVADDGKRLSVTVAGKRVLVYNQAVVASPLENEPYYARSGYIHPVYNPSGQVVTDDFNPDHAHQHGIMFAWRKITFEGRESNGWDQKAGTGRVEHVATDGFGGGPVFGWFDVRLRQLDLTAPDGPKPVLNDRWRVRVYNVSDHYLFDLQMQQTCAGQSPVTVDEIHYGGLMIRGHARWQETKEFDFLTSEGKTKTDGNHTRPRWCDLYGRLGSGSTGVAIFDWPGNFRFPQPVRLHPSMPYFCYTPATAGTLTIEPGEPYTARYRFCVHDGNLAATDADRLWSDFGDPPNVRITKEP